VSALNKAVARSEINAGVVLPAGLQADERSGQPVPIRIVAEQADTTQQLTPCATQGQYQPDAAAGG
jgi:hypothetical protein